MGNTPDHILATGLLYSVESKVTLLSHSDFLNDISLWHVPVRNKGDFLQCLCFCCGNYHDFGNSVQNVDVTAQLLSLKWFINNIGSSAGGVLDLAKLAASAIHQIYITRRLIWIENFIRYLYILPWLWLSRPACMSSLIRLWFDVSQILITLRFDFPTSNSRR